MTHTNEMNLGFDADETKTLTDLEALELMLQKPDHRQAFLEQIDRLVKQKEALLLSQESYKDLINSTKDAFKFKTNKMINMVINSIINSKLNDDIHNATAEIDLLVVVKDHVESK